MQEKYRRYVIQRKINMNQQEVPEIATSCAQNNPFPPKQRDEELQDKVGQYFSRVGNSDFICNKGEQKDKYGIWRYFHVEEIRYWLEI